MQQHFRVRLAHLVPLALVAAVACDSASNGPFPPVIVPPALTSITVTDNPRALAVNTTGQFVAVGRDASGAVFPVTVVWTVANPTSGSINASSGLFTAGSTVGTYTNTITATSGLISGMATVTVSATAPVLATMVIAPNPVSSVVLGTAQFVASGFDGAGNSIAISPATTWSVVTAAAGTINATSGLFTASATPGTYVGAVRATSGTISALATVTVTAAAPVLAAITVSPNPANPAVGTTQQFTATGRDGSGNLITMSPAPTWTVVTAAAGTINASTGLFTASATPGTYPNAVRATSGTISGFANVTVSTAVSVGPSFGTADPFAVLGSTAISCIGVSTIAGNVGVAPAGSVSGFPAPCVIASPGDPTPHVNDALALTAQADVTPAYNALAAMPCGTALTGFDLGGMTLAPGVYCFTSSAQLTGNVTLAGPANGLWVFQVGTALTTATSSQVVLSGGAQARNVFWQVGTSATLGQTTIFRGNIVAAVSITMVQGSTLVGRALSKAGITMDGNTITLP
jgi:hypothetical protein